MIAFKLQEFLIISFISICHSKIVAGVQAKAFLYSCRDKNKLMKFRSITHIVELSVD